MLRPRSHPFVLQLGLGRVVHGVDRLRIGDLGHLRLAADLADDRLGGGSTEAFLDLAQCGGHLFVGVLGLVGRGLGRRAGAGSGLVGRSGGGRLAGRRGGSEADCRGVGFEGGDELQDRFFERHLLFLRRS